MGEVRYISSKKANEEAFMPKGQGVKKFLSEVKPNWP